MAKPPAESYPASRTPACCAADRRAADEAVTRQARPSTDVSGLFTSGMATLVVLAWGAACSAPADHHHPLAQHGPPAITGNPAADPTLPPRLGRPGRLLLGCTTRTTRGPETAELYASAVDFDDGRQSFFLKRLDSAGRESVYPLHGHFLDGGRSGIFMVHDGKGVKDGDAYRIDQSVNMGVLFLRTADSGLSAILDVFAEENVGEPGEKAGRPLIHAHSFPHRTKASMLDTLEETETVIGGLLLVPAETGYTGWIGLAGSSADPFNLSFSRDATVGDYAAQGRAVVPPLPVTCQ